MCFTIVRRNAALEIVLAPAGFKGTARRRKSRPRFVSSTNGL
jgi:hypothetical protein